MRPRWNCWSIVVDLVVGRLRAAPAFSVGTGDVVDGDRHATTRRVVEADRLDAVDEVRRLGRAEQPVAVGDQLAQRRPVHGLVDEAQPVRQRLVEDDPADGRPDRLR